MYFESLLIINVASQVIGLKATEFQLGNTPAIFRRDAGNYIKLAMTLMGYTATIVSFFFLPWYAVIGFTILGLILAAVLRSILPWLHANAFVAIACCGLTVSSLAFILLGFLGD